MQCLKSNLYLYPVPLIVLKVKTWWKKKGDKIKKSVKIKIYRCTKHGYERVYEANFQWTSTETEIVIVSLAERQLDRRGFPMEHDVAWPDLIVFKELDSFNSSNCTKYPLQTITIQRLNFYTRVFRDIV